MRKNISFFLLTSTLSLISTGCQDIIYKLRTEKKCDVTSLSKKIYDGCDITPEVENAFPEISSSVFIRTSFTNYSKDATCSGNFISEHIILTAGHCLIKKEIDTATKNITHILIANENKFNSTENESYESIIKEKYTNNSPEYHIVHPYYRQNAKVNDDPKFGVEDFADLALIYSPKSATEIGVKTVKLTSETLKKEMVYLIGYGKKSDTEKDISRTNPIVLKKWGIAYSTEKLDDTINSYVFEDKNNKKWNIKDYWKENIVKNSYISIPYSFQSPVESFLVIEGQTNENGLCQGDSGGAIFVQRNNEFIAAAVTHSSNGENCSDKVSTNTKVGAYKDWIIAESQNLAKKHGTIEYINFIN